jgi:hypothetical protein
MKWDSNYKWTPTPWWRIDYDNIRNLIRYGRNPYYSKDKDGYQYWFAPLPWWYILYEIVTGWLIDMYLEIFYLPKVRKTGRIPDESQTSKS